MRHKSSSGQCCVLRVLEHGWTKDRQEGVWHLCNETLEEAAVAVKATTTATKEQVEDPGRDQEDGDGGSNKYEFLS